MYLMMPYGQFVSIHSLILDLSQDQCRPFFVSSQSATETGQEERAFLRHPVNGTRNLMSFVSTHLPPPYQPVPFASTRVHLFYDFTIYLPFLFHDFPPTYTVKAGNSLTSGSASFARFSEHLLPLSPPMCFDEVLFLLVDIRALNMISINLDFKFFAALGY